MAAILIYMLTICSSFFLNWAVIGVLGIGGGDIGILNMALIGASVVLGIVMGKCLRSLSENGFKVSMLLIPVLCLAIPAVALASHYLLAAYPGKLLAVILKYLYCAVYTVVGILPSLITNVLYAILKGVSEDASIGGCIVGLIVPSALEGIFLGRGLVEKLNPYIGPPRRRIVIEDEDGTKHEVYVDD